jgi:hypothetical protein
VYHIRFEVTTLASIDLNDLGAGGGDAVGVVRRLLVAFDDETGEVGFQIPEGAFEQGCFAAARRTDEVDGEDIFRLKKAPVPFGKEVVFTQNVLLDLQHGFARLKFRSRRMDVMPVIVMVMMTGMVVFVVFMFVHMNVGGADFLYPDSAVGLAAAADSAHEN